MQRPRRKSTLRGDVDAHVADDDSRTLMVPLSDRELVPTSVDRVRKLRKHLTETLRALPKTREVAPSISQLLPEPQGFVARVAQTACTLCQGWCCKAGGEHAYLDEPTMARVRQTRKGLTARAILKLYIERVPTLSQEGSCVFHGPTGCTLDRSLRSDICNNYFCHGLGTYVTSDDSTSPVVVIAGEGKRMRSSAVLTPRKL